MTQNERSSMVRLWTLVGLIFTALGAAAGFGMAEGVNKKTLSDNTEKIKEHGEILKIHTAAIHELELVDRGRESDMRYIRKSLEEIKAALQDSRHK